MFNYLGERLVAVYVAAPGQLDRGQGNTTGACLSRHGWDGELLLHRRRRSGRHHLQRVPGCLVLPLVVVEDDDRDGAVQIRGRHIFWGFGRERMKGAELALVF